MLQPFAVMVIPCLHSGQFLWPSIMFSILKGFATIERAELRKRTAGGAAPRLLPVLTLTRGIRSVPRSAFTITTVGGAFEDMVLLLLPGRFLVVSVICS
jgi:hypothetical protein